MGKKLTHAEQDAARDRLQNFLYSQGITVNNFAKRASIATSNFSRMLKGQQSISENTLIKISDAFGIDFSDIIGDDNKAIVVEDLRPHIPITAQAGSLVGIGETVTRSDCEMRPVIPGFPSYMATIPVHGDSMEPEFHNGDVLAITKVDSFVQWGKTYVLDTRDGVVIKKLYEDESGMRCVSFNKDYPDFVVPKNDVIGIWRIVGMLRLI